jgi:hypothetical protein
MWLPGLAGSCWICAGPQVGREELFAALLRQVSEPGTLDVVVMEDVHWADVAAVDMLRFVGRRIKNAACCSLPPTG